MYVHGAPSLLPLDPDEYLVSQEYTRENVLVHPLGPLTALSSTPVPRPTVPNIGSTLSNTATDAYIVPLTAPELPRLDSLPPALSAQTYIYAGPLKGLSPELWSYEDFVRENAWKWVGRGAHDNEHYVEVDRRREMDGKTLKTEIVDGGSILGSDNDGKSVAVEVKGP